MAECVVCGKSHNVPRSSYCSKQCRQTAWNKKRREQLPYDAADLKLHGYFYSLVMPKEPRKHRKCLTGGCGETIFGRRDERFCSKCQVSRSRMRTAR